MPIWVIYNTCPQVSIDVAILLYCLVPVVCRRSLPPNVLSKVIKYCFTIDSDDEQTIALAATAAVAVAYHNEKLSRTL